MKYLAFGIYKWASQDMDSFLVFIIWLIVAAIESGIVALIVAGIAKLCDKDFEEWFAGAFGIMAVIEVINGIILLLS